jgi:hypothetical protein
MKNYPATKARTSEASRMVREPAPTHNPFAMPAGRRAQRAASRVSGLPTGQSRRGDGLVARLLDALRGDV